jgi:hypothetical protein
MKYPTEEELADNIHYVIPYELWRINKNVCRHNASWGALLTMIENPHMTYEQSKTKHFEIMNWHIDNVHN